MADDFWEYIEPVHGGAPVRRQEGTPPPEAHPQHERTIPGRIVGVHRRTAQHAGEDHQLDVTIGGEDFTEIILRVANGTYEHLEGLHAVLHITE